MKQLHLFVHMLGGLLWVLGAPLLAGAQTSAQTGVPSPLTTGNTVVPAKGLLDGKDQLIQRITHEDEGSKIDEIRYGGVTQSITVQSKLGGQPYEIVPADGTRNIAPGWNNASDSAGKAHWKVGNF